MDPPKTLMEACEGLAEVSKSSVKTFDRCLQHQTLKMDSVFDSLLNQAREQKQKDSAVNVPKKKKPKNQSKTNNDQFGDLFAAEPSFQQPAIPPTTRTRRQASIAAAGKVENIRESQAISSGVPTKKSLARSLSVCMNVSSINLPKATSSIVVNKKCLENEEECLSPELFSPEKNETYTVKCSNSDQTYYVASSSTANLTKKSTKNVNVIPEKPSLTKVNSTTDEKNKTTTKITTKIKGENSQIKGKNRKKLGDIDVNMEAQRQQVSQHMTRTMAKKLQEDKREHKSKPDKSNLDDQHAKAAKQRVENVKRIEEKIEKIAEKKTKQEEKEKEKKLTIKKPAFEKQNQVELRPAEINKKLQFAEEAKKLKLQKEELDSKLKENKIKKKNEFKSEEGHFDPSVRISNVPSSSKNPTIPKTKIETTASNENDYGLNDVSVGDSSDDEIKPKKTVPDWAKPENRKVALELQFHVDPVERDLFFDCPTSVNIKEMFEGWNIRDKQRTSSAVWNTPPNRRQ